MKDILNFTFLHPNLYDLISIDLKKIGKFFRINDFDHRPLPFTASCFWCIISPITLTMTNDRVNFQSTVLILNIFTHFFASQLFRHKTKKAAVLLVIFSSAAIAQENAKKWIPIEPVQETAAASGGINKPPRLSDSKLVHNLSVIKKLLDGVAKEPQDQESTKKWYPLESDENE